MVYQEFRHPLIYPIHPRSERKIEEFSLQAPSGVKLVQPLGFLDFLNLEAKAALVLTDSGGIQEETCILKVPCITLRDSTEHLITVEKGTNILSGLTFDAVSKAVNKSLAFDKVAYSIPKQLDGRASERIIKVLKDFI